VAQDMEEPKQYLVGRIREAMATDSRVNELDVQVSVSGKKVFLSGNVPTEERKQQIDAVAAELLPDYEIHNQTTVRSYQEPLDVEELT
jgi:osmotically-inducible protein OsmY